MTIDLVKRILDFAALCLMQALVLNRIHLLGCATPLLYVYMVIVFPNNYPKWGVLLWSFMLGLAIDSFSNTPGVAAASLTFVGAVQPYFFRLFIQHDAPDNIAPSVRSIGLVKFTFYAVVLVLLYCLLFFTLEMFSFFNWMWWLQCVGGCAAVTVILILTIESVRKK